MTNFVRTTMGTGDTAINLGAVSEFPSSGGIVTIGTERIAYSTSTTHSLKGCTRGYEGTTAATHAVGAAVTLLTTTSLIQDYSADSAETITPDATAASIASISVKNAITINGPTGGVDGQKMVLRLVQDGTGHAVTLATGAGNFAFGSTITSFAASAANLTDYLGVIYNATANRWHVASLSQGF